jgi:hypothetical protein
VLIGGRYRWKWEVSLLGSEAAGLHCTGYSSASWEKCEMLRGMVFHDGADPNAVRWTVAKFCWPWVSCQISN